MVILFARVSVLEFLQDSFPRFLAFLPELHSFHRISSAFPLA